MDYEVDFLPVDRGSKGGDAIALRYGDLHGFPNTQTVVVIDGGYSADGHRLVQHIQDRYNTDRVDIVISTHPHEDHVAGLLPVVEQLEVGRLWMHQPWRHSRAMELSKAAGFQAEHFGDYITASLKQVSELEAAAQRRGIPIAEPFVGTQSDDGRLVIVGPTVEYYEHLVKQFPAGGELFTKAAVAESVPESMAEETLTDGGKTDAQNNSSVICLLDMGDRSLLFTGDAGIPAMNAAADRLNAIGLHSGDLYRVQVPHHGSRANVGPTVLDRLLGPRTDQLRGRGIVSAPREGAPHFPSKAVTNAFLRRGYPVVATRGRTIRTSCGAPPRDGWVRTEPLPLYPEVDSG